MTANRQPGTFELGRVIQRTFGAISRNLPVFLGLALLLTGLPAFVVAWAQVNSDSNAAALAGGLGTLVNLVTTYILQAALVHGTVADLNGRRASLGQALRVGGRMFLPVLAISILLGIAVGLGVLLLIVPGLIMLTIWMVAVPAQVVERTGVFGAFSRSRDLTRGNRWKVFGLMLIFFLLGGLMLLLAGFLGYAFTPDADSTMSIPGAVVLAFTQAVSAMIAAVGVAAIYYELRSAKEGVGPEALAAVFA